MSPESTGEGRGACELTMWEQEDFIGVSQWVICESQVIKTKEKRVHV